MFVMFMGVHESGFHLQCVEYPQGDVQRFLAGAFAFANNIDLVSEQPFQSRVGSGVLRTCNGVRGYKLPSPGMILNRVADERFGRSRIDYYGMIGYEIQDMAQALLYGTHRYTDEDQIRGSYSFLQRQDLIHQSKG